jgi:hypothetical protein
VTHFVGFLHDISFHSENHSYLSCTAYIRTKTTIHDYKITLWRTVLLEKPVKRFREFIETEGSLLLSQKPTVCPY